MAERKKQKTKRREKNKNQGDEPTKEEYAVAKFVRFNCPTKSTIIMGNDMHYFTASKAVDSLMSSKWASDKVKAKLFTNRQSCVDYMQRLLEKGLLFRAKKLVPKRKDRSTPAEVTKDQLPALKEKKEEARRKESAEKSPKKEKRRKSVDESKEREEKQTEEDDKGKKDKDAKKKPKKVKFEIHQQQVFADGNDIYVWKYDPTSMKTFILGLGIVVGAICVCLFPLWPPQVRLGVYYLSLVAMGFVGVIISLVVIRSILFGVIWATSWGKHHFWLLPNLTEDCGFFESFKPFYSYKFSGDTNVDEKKRKKSKSSDKEESGDDKDKEDDNGKESEDDEATKNAPTDTDRISDDDVEGKNSGSEDEDREKETTLIHRKKSANDFELVDAEDSEH